MWSPEAGQLCGRVAWSASLPQAIAQKVLGGWLNNLRGANCSAISVTIVDEGTIRNRAKQFHHVLRFDNSVKSRAREYTPDYCALEAYDQVDQAGQEQILI